VDAAHGECRQKALPQAADTFSNEALMKYGKIIQHYPPELAHPVMNIGDIVQTISVENLFEQMGIAGEQIAEVGKYDLKHYSGERLVIPITGYFNERPGRGEVPFSPDVIPVFLGYHVGWGLYDDAVVEYFKRFQPIGCRDNKSKRAFLQRGISAYVNGCSTVAFARRQDAAGRERTFFVDVPESLNPYIPESLLEQGEFLSHIVPIEQQPLGRQEYDRLVAYTHHLLNRYRDEARLVVTSRLHCALPCLAMGIPVIFVTQNLPETCDFLTSLIRIHSPQDFEGIDWEPAVVDLEAIKRECYENFQWRMQAALQGELAAQRLDSFYQASQGVTYYRDEQECLKRLFGDSFKGDYILWGVGTYGAKLYDLMCSLFPEARLVKCCDSSADYDFFGNAVLRPAELPGADAGVKILVATSYGIPESEEFLDSRGLQKGIDYDSFLMRVWDLPAKP
jgi:hypothetical protein